MSITLKKKTSFHNYLNKKFYEYWRCHQYYIIPIFYFLLFIKGAVQRFYIIRSYTILSKSILLKRNINGILNAIWTGRNVPLWEKWSVSCPTGCFDLSCKHQLTQNYHVTLVTGRYISGKLHYATFQRNKKCEWRKITLSHTVNQPWVDSKYLKKWNSFDYGIGKEKWCSKNRFSRSRKKLEKKSIKRYCTLVSKLENTRFDFVLFVAFASS